MRAKGLVQGYRYRFVERHCRSQREVELPVATFREDFMRDCSGPVGEDWMRETIIVAIIEDLGNFFLDVFKAFLIRCFSSHLENNSIAVSVVVVSAACVVELEDSFSIIGCHAKEMKAGLRDGLWGNRLEALRRN